MNARLRIAAVTLVTLLVFALPALSGEWSADQKSAWAFIEKQWEDAMKKDTTWIEKSLHASFQGWGNDNPAPRGKKTMGAWTRYNDQNSTTLMQSLYPLEVIVVGDTAVAHYFYSTASENREKKRETTHGRYTDVLVKKDGQWQFLAWHGGDHPKKN